jgi:undecaprenyl-phosphate 4-deoxy-4-formamido-L-arabinose transferase
MSREASPRSVSIVIPVYNEAASIVPLVSRCLAACESLRRPFEIVLVDDGSRDASADLIAAAAREHAPLSSARCSPGTTGKAAQ